MVSYRDNVHLAAHAILSAAKFQLGNDGAISFPDPQLVAKLAIEYTRIVESTVDGYDSGFQSRGVTTPENIVLLPVTRNIP